MTQREEVADLALLAHKNIILASNSPRRKEILASTGIKFKVMAPNIDEKLNQELTLREAMIDLSKRKAQSVKVGDIVIAADTLVIYKDRILGKPQTVVEAFDMLKTLSGDTHDVFTAVTIKTDEKIYSFLSENKVKFFELSDEEIMGYIKEKEYVDKAGGYAIQGNGAFFVDKIAGDFYSIMGLPKARVYKYLKQIDGGY